MLPAFNNKGNLPAGVHWGTWDEFVERFGTNATRRRQLDGLATALTSLRNAGCKTAYLNGSFVTEKEEPGDFDACWDIRGVDPELLDPVLLDFSDSRAAQKRKYLGELFPAQMPEGISGITFMEFFQTDPDSGEAKGIVAISLETVPR